MKINKIVISICHFFGFYKDVEHIDNVSIEFPLEYDNNDNLIFSDKNHDYLIQLLEKTPKLKKRCSNIKGIYVIEKTTKLIMFLGYIDGVIYTKDKYVEYDRELKLKKLVG